MRVSVLLVLLAAAAAVPVLGLYEDQVGVNDWHKQMLGDVVSAEFVADQLAVVTTAGAFGAAGSAALLRGYRAQVLEQPRVLAGMVPRTGQITWKHVFEAPNTLLASVFVSDSLVVTLAAPARLSLWRTATGALVWETHLSAAASPAADDCAPAQLAATPLLVVVAQHSLTLSGVCVAHVTAVDVSSGVPAWHTAKPLPGAVDVVAVHRGVHALTAGTIISLDATSGKELATRAALATADAGNACIGIHAVRTASGAPVWIMACGSAGVHVVRPAATGTAAAALSDTHVGMVARIVATHAAGAFVLEGEDGRLAVFAVSDDGAAPRHVLTTDAAAHVSLNDAAGWLAVATVAHGAADADLFLLDLATGQRHAAAKGMRFNDVDAIARLFLRPIGDATRIVGNVMAVADDAAIAMAKYSAAHGWTTAWTRHEALAAMLDAVFVRVPDTLAVETAPALSLSWSEWLLTSQATARAEFGFEQVILCPTAFGRVLGVDTLTGDVLWSTRVPQGRSCSDMHVLVERDHPPLAPLALLACPSAGALARLDVMTGALTPLPPLPPGLVLVAGVPGAVSHEHRRVFAALYRRSSDADWAVRIVPAGADAAAAAGPVLQRGLHLHVVDDSGITGVLATGEDSLRETFRLPLGAAATILDVAYVPADELVNAPALIRGDRSILPKYLNRNAVAVASLNTTLAQLHVHVLDTVSGRVIAHVTRDNAAGPVRVVMSENSVYYHYWDRRGNRFELGVLSMFDSRPVDWVTSTFSSYQHTQPSIEQRAYISPTAVRAAAITVSARGISNKHVVLALANNQLVAVPQRQLDARRPTSKPTAVQAEEGLLQYRARVSIPPASVLSYNHTLAAVRGIASAPAELESTSHVLAFGNDLFYLRVAPSGHYDALGVDFSHLNLLGTIALLLVATLVAKRMSAMRDVSRVWA